MKKLMKKYQLHNKLNIIRRFTSNSRNPTNYNQVRWFTSYSGVCQIGASSGKVKIVDPTTKKIKQFLNNQIKRHYILQNRASITYGDEEQEQENLLSKINNTKR